MVDHAGVQCLTHHATCRSLGWRILNPVISALPPTYSIAGYSISILEECRVSDSGRQLGLDQRASVSLWLWAGYPNLQGWVSTSIKSFSQDFSGYYIK